MMKKFYRFCRRCKQKFKQKCETDFDYKFFFTIVFILLTIPLMMFLMRGASRTMVDILGCI